LKYRQEIDEAKKAALKSQKDLEKAKKEIEELQDGKYNRTVNNNNRAPASTKGFGSTRNSVDGKKESIVDDIINDSTEFINGNQPNTNLPTSNVTQGSSNKTKFGPGVSGTISNAPKTKRNNEILSQFRLITSSGIDFDIEEDSSGLQYIVINHKDGRGSKKYAFNTSDDLRLLFKKENFVTSEKEIESIIQKFNSISDESNGLEELKELDDKELLSEIDQSVNDVAYGAKRLKELNALMAKLITKEKL
jgi:hypothetical protein